MLNRGNPALEAVKISPTPLLSTTRPANEVLAETLAAGKVPLFGVAWPTILRAALVVDCPPNRVSTVELYGKRDPEVCLQYDSSPVVDMVIDPSPFAIEMFPPPVRFAAVNPPEALPMRSCPCVKLVTPVPPRVTGRVPVVSLPEALVWSAPAPNPDRTISPVEALPNVRVCLLVVERIPVPVK